MNALPENFGPRLFTEEMRQKARATRLASIEAGKHYKRDFADDSHWQVLAKAQNIQLPQWHLPPTPSNMRRYFKKLGLAGKEPHWLEACAYKRLADFAKFNPTWPLRAFVGLLLEWQSEMALVFQKVQSHLGNPEIEGENGNLTM